MRSLSPTPANVSDGDGRYRLLVKLGSGGMADVFVGVSRTSSGLEKLAVIKRLRSDLGEDPEEVEHLKGMFLDEARLAMLLNHANVVHAHDACEDGDSLYLVMEYIEGQALSNVQRELVRQGRPLSPVHSALIVSEVLAGLHYAHDLKSLTGEQLNIVHRDVSPQNILLGYDGSIKLVDFGVAMAESRLTETRAGTLKGKARYMSPEQVMNRPVDRRSDVYAAGAVLWELLARRKIVAGANILEQLVNVMKAEPERLSTLVPDVDPGLEAIVHKALAREPSDRFQTAQAMRDALLAWANRDGDVRVAEIGRLVSECFATTREEVGALVRQRLAMGHEAGGPVSLRAARMGDSSASSSSSAEGPRSASLPANTAGVSFTQLGVVQNVGPTSTSEPLTRGSKKTTTALVAALLASLLVVGTLAGMLASSARRGSARPRGTMELTAAPRDGESVGPTPPSPAPSAERPAAVEDLSLTVLAHTADTAGKAGAAAPPPARGVAAPQPPRGGSPVPAAQRAPAATVAVVAPPREPAPAPAAAPPPTVAATSHESEQGYLTIDTYPWTRVSEGGRTLGNTPLVRIPMSTGTHVLTLENPQDNVHQTTTVIVKPGETVSRRLAF